MAARRADKEPEAAAPPDAPLESIIPDNLVKLVVVREQRLPRHAIGRVCLMYHVSRRISGNGGITISRSLVGANEPLVEMAGS